MSQLVRNDPKAQQHPVWRDFRNTSSILVIFFWKLVMPANNTRKLREYVPRKVGGKKFKNWIDVSGFIPIWLPTPEICRLVCHMQSLSYTYHIWHILDMHGTETKHIVRHSQKSGLYKAQKKKLFVSCNGPERNRAGRSEKIGENIVGRSEKNLFFLHYFLVKDVCFMHVFRWLGVGRAKKNFWVEIFLNNNLLV